MTSKYDRSPCRTYATCKCVGDINADWTTSHGEHSLSRKTQASFQLRAEGYYQFKTRFDCIINYCAQTDGRSLSRMPYCHDLYDIVLRMRIDAWPDLCKAPPVSEGIVFVQPTGNSSNKQLSFE